MKSESSMQPYVRLAISLLISYAVMVVLMFSRVNVFSNVFLSLN